MRKIKLSGRETAVVRSIDYAEGTPGLEIKQRTHIELEDLVDVINGLMDAGFVETIPPSLDHVTTGTFDSTVFEINPSYTLDLRAAMRR